MQEYKVYKAGQEGASRRESVPDSETEAGDWNADTFIEYIKRNNGVIEGKTLPVDKKMLFRDFDLYVSKDLKPAVLAGPNGLQQYDRSAIREVIEKDVYGASMKDVKKYLKQTLLTVTDKEREISVRAQNNWDEFTPAEQVEHYENILSAEELEELITDLEEGNFGNVLSEVKNGIFSLEQQIGALRLKQHNTADNYGEKISELEQKMLQLESLERRLLAESRVNYKVDDSSIYETLEKKGKFLNESSSLDNDDLSDEIDQLFIDINRKNYTNAIRTLNTMIKRNKYIINLATSNGPQVRFSNDDEIKRTEFVQGKEILQEQYGSMSLAKTETNKLIKYRDALIDRDRKSRYGGSLYKKQQ